MRGGEIYYREDLSETHHKLEQALEPAAHYYWSVRGRSGGNVGAWASWERRGVAGTMTGMWWIFRTPGR
jgi:hypothetical protein